MLEKIIDKVLSIWTNSKTITRIFIISAPALVFIVLIIAAAMTGHLGLLIEKWFG